MRTFFSGRGRTFKNGIHPVGNKKMTRSITTRRMPFISNYVLPLSQHLGAPSKPVVKSGEKVLRGQLIAEAGGFVSAALHAPVTGRVSAIEPREHPSGSMKDAIVIERDIHSSQVLSNGGPCNWEEMDREELLQEIRKGGFVGLGGAAFPTHVKLAVPEGKKAQFFLINAGECEPYLNSDYRLMLEQSDLIFTGIKICMKILQAEKAYIGIENNKIKAIELLESRKPAGLNCEIISLQTKYPQGAEKMMIDAILKREVPGGKLPIDAAVVVNNVGTVAGIGEYFISGKPLIERIVTLTGPGLRRPANLLIPIGTNLRDVLNYCGGLTDNVKQILFGGPMMGSPQRSLDVPIMKGTSGVVCLTDEEILPRSEGPCIRCLRCVDACPVYLNPSALGALARVSRYNDMVDYHIMDCMECGCCSYVCPSHIPLVQRFRVGKAFLREEMSREKASA